MTDLRDNADRSTPLQGSNCWMPVARWETIQDQVRRRKLIETAIGNPAIEVPTIDRFELCEHVGSGGMGAVFKAYDPELRRIVAIKLCKFEDGQAANAIEHEARCLAKVAHPNVVAAYDVVRTDTDVLLVMEFVKGQTLHAWLGTAPSWREIVEHYVDAGHGLEAVHAAGLEHGDFKPNNVLVGDDGRVRVADFGIARHLARPAMGDDFDVTGKGTRGYMAPERLRGQPSDARADVFSFCVSVWEALYGVRPYSGKTILALLESMESGTLQTDRVLPGTPDAIRPILAAGISPRVDERPPSMTPLLRALSDVPELEQHRIVQRRRVTVVSAILGLLAVVVFQAIALQRVEPIKPETQREPMVVEPAEPEPSMARAMSLAARADPFGARAEFIRVEEQNKVDVDGMLRLACILVDRARTLPKGPRETTLHLAEQIASSAEFKAQLNEIPAQVQAARSLVAMIEVLS